MINDFQNIHFLSKRQRRSMLINNSCNCTWVAVGAAAVTVVGGVIQGQQAKKNAPKPAQYAAVDPQAEQKKAIQGNLANLGQVENLTNQTNQFSQQQANSMMEQAVPGYRKAADQLMKFGQERGANPYAVPKEVTDNLNRIASERGVSVGQGPGGQFGQYSALRDLGVNELQYGQQNFQDAIQALTTVTGTAPRVSPVSPMSFYLTPQQQLNATTNNNTESQAINQGANNANSAANNWANQNLWSSIGSGVQTAGGAYNKYQAGQNQNPFNTPLPSGGGSSTAIPAAVGAP